MLKSSQQSASSEGSREECFFLFQLLVGPRVPWLVEASLGSQLPFSHDIFLWVAVSSLLLTKTPVAGFRKALNPGWFHLEILSYYINKDPIFK